MPGLLLRLIGLLLLCSALALPLMRAGERPVESLVGRWAPPPSTFLDLNGQLVHLRDEGPRRDPLPIVLLHGMSSSLHTWDGWVRALRGERRVIRMDLPGFGLTGPLSGAYAGLPYTADTDLRVLRDLLDRLGVARCVLVGHSLGGELAWRLAAQSPERVAQLVLVDAAGLRFTPDALPLGWQVARLPGVGALAADLLPRPLVVQGLTVAMGDPAHLTDAMVDRYFELMLRDGNRAAQIARIRAWSPDNGVDHVRGVQAPTLILWGGRDRLIPPAQAQRLAADIPGSRLQVFGALGHLPQEEDPAATVAALRAFLGMTPAVSPAVTAVVAPDAARPPTATASPSAPPTGAPSTPARP